MLDKLKSRKFWVTVGGGCALVFADALGIRDVVVPLVALLSSYLIGQSYVDRAALPGAK